MASEDDKKARLAQALRANLRRRKAQARGVERHEAENAEAAPSANPADTGGSGEDGQ